MTMHSVVHTVGKKTAPMFVHLGKMLQADF